MAQQEMMKLTDIKVQESPNLTGANRQKGITKDDLSTKRVTFSDPVHAAVAGKIEEALSGIMEQVEAWASEYNADGAAIVASMRANIANFKLDAGGGYTSTLKAYLLENGTESGVEVLAEDFVDPKNRGGGSDSVAPSALPTGDLELD